MKCLTIAALADSVVKSCRDMFGYDRVMVYKFDPDGHYVRAWVPELAGVPDNKLAEPWTMTDEDQAAEPEDRLPKPRAPIARRLDVIACRRASGAIVHRPRRQRARLPRRSDVHAMPASRRCGRG